MYTKQCTLYNVYSCAEMLRLFEWIKRYNNFHYNQRKGDDDGKRQIISCDWNKVFIPLQQTRMKLEPATCHRTFKTLSTCWKPVASFSACGWLTVTQTDSMRRGNKNTSSRIAFHTNSIHFISLLRLGCRWNVTIIDCDLITERSISGTYRLCILFYM